MHTDVSLFVSCYFGTLNKFSKTYYNEYIVLQTVQTYVTFNSVTTYKQCLSYHESKFFLVQLVVSVNNKLTVIIMKHK